MINIFAECGPITEGGILLLNDILSEETLALILAEAGEAIERCSAAVYERCNDTKWNDTGWNEEARLKRLTKVGNGALHCVACGCSECDRLEIDHIVPKSKGGRDRMDNLQLLCVECNRSKGVKSMDEWLAVRL